MNEELIISKIEELLVKLGSTATKTWEAVHQRVIVSAYLEIVFFFVLVFVMIALELSRRNGNYLWDEEKNDLSFFILPYTIISVVLFVYSFVVMFSSLPNLFATDYAVIDKLISMVK